MPNRLRPGIRLDPGNGRESDERPYHGCYVRQGRCRKNDDDRISGSGFGRMGKKVLLVDADMGLRDLDLAVGQEMRFLYTVGSGAGKVF